MLRMWTIHDSLKIVSDGAPLAMVSPSLWDRNLKPANLCLELLVKKSQEIDLCCVNIEND